MEKVIDTFLLDENQKLKFAWYWATYNNALVEIDKGSKKVWIPSFYNNKSEFIRYKLLDKTYSKYRQQRFEATIKAGELLDALGKIGNNVNQIAKVLNTYKDGKMRREELLVMVSAIKLIGKVKAILEEIPEE